MRIVLLLLAALAGDAEPVTRVRLLPRASVRGLELRLADVARCEGPRAAELRALRLGYTPSPGSERRLDASSVEARVAAAGLPKSAVVVEPGSCVATVETVSIPGSEIARRVTEELRRRLGADARIEVAEAGDLVVPRPAEDVAPTIEVSPRPLLLRGTFAVDVHATAAGDRLGSTTVSTTVRLEAPVFVAREPIARGDRVDFSRVEVRQVDVTHLRGEPIRDASALAGRAAARAIAADAILTADDLVTPPLYRKNDTARLVIRRGSLRIDALVRVDAEAAIGDRVPVTCLEFQRSLVAVVRPDGSLEPATGAPR